ncbi:uncharacterized protein SCHCODRAFT_02601101 [Schizophyllum commune H4-8]|nr:uncharacterized protein SCHCODRAFT_02601101 [Schizophyllum commune H4-8]KAI5890610.1 hypothetical protein SCHCODRAFT_02601101 [Schizophyllum commune H4-8]
MSSRRQYTRTDQYAAQWTDAPYSSPPANYPSTAYQQPQQSMPAYDAHGSQMYATDPYYAGTNPYGASPSPVQQSAPRAAYPVVDSVTASMGAMAVSQPCARYPGYSASASSGGYASTSAYASQSVDAYAPSTNPQRAGGVPIPMRRPTYDPAVYGRSPTGEGMAYIQPPMHHHRSGFHSSSGMAAPHDDYALDYADEYGHPDARESSPFGASQARPYACDICQLAFNRQHDLKRHRETHTGEKPYLCNGGCGKTFTRKDALKRHQLVKGCGKIDEA